MLAGKRKHSTQTNLFGAKWNSFYAAKTFCSIPNHIKTFRLLLYPWQIDCGKNINIRARSTARYYRGAMANFLSHASRSHSIRLCLCPFPAAHSNLVCIIVYMLDSPIKLKTHLLFQNCIKTCAHDVYDEFKMNVTVGDSVRRICERCCGFCLLPGYVCQSNNNSGEIVCSYFLASATSIRHT